MHHTTASPLNAHVHIRDLLRFLENVGGHGDSVLSAESWSSEVHTVMHTLRRSRTHICCHLGHALPHLTPVVSPSLTPQPLEAPFLCVPPSNLTGSLHLPAAPDQVYGMYMNRRVLMCEHTGCCPAKALERLSRERDSDCTVIA